MASISCMTWVKRGVAKQNPDKVALGEDELKKLILSQEARLNDLELADSSDDDDEGETIEAAADSGAVKRKRGAADDDEASSEDEGEDGEEEEDPANIDDIAKKYGLDDYDDGGDNIIDGIEEDAEDGNNPFGVGGLTYYSSQKDDPYLSKEPDNDDDDDDVTVEPDDNMIAIGKMHGDFCNLEVYVYNQAQENLFCHHDILLPSMPLALEWLNFDPTEEQPGNYVAMGTMEPDIEVWDLDMMDAVEPAFILAGAQKKKKGSKKKKKTSKTGHSDAVLALSWNALQPKVLASGSADFTVGIWDLTNGTMVSCIRHHEEKVQAIEWHPFEAQSLLSGSFDHTARVYDCRSPGDSHKSWTLPGEVECVAWNKHDPYYFLASSDTGHVYYMDVRTGDPVFTLQAHHGAVTGLSVSHQTPGCIMTASQDKVVKVWDIRDNKPSMILEKTPKMGPINCLGASPDAGLIFAVAGERELRVMNLHKNEDVAHHFGTEAVAAEGKDAELLAATGMEDDGEEEEMMGPEAAGDEGAAAAEAKPKKKKKNKKKKKQKEAE